MSYGAIDCENIAYQKVVLSSFDNGLNTAEIAIKLHAPEAEVTKYLHQALAKRRASGPS